MECVSFERVDVATFRTDPRDRVVVIGPWTFWQLGEHLAGLTAVGAVRAPDMVTGEPLYAAIASRGAGGKSIISDLSRVHLGRTDPRTIWHGSLINQRLRQDVERVVSRFALLVPLTPSGALLAGMVALYGESRIAFKVSSVRAELGAWLGPDVPFDRIGATLAGLATAEPQGASSAVRKVLARSPTLGIEAVARELATTSRTLRRELTAAGTSFRREQLGARIERASALLAAGAASLGEVAAQVGVRSLRHFTTRYREVVGRAPRLGGE